jgi:hypothetical protein
MSLEVQPNHLNDEISLKEIVLRVRGWTSYISSKWQLILPVIILGAVLGLAYAYTRKTVYRAELSFALENDQGGSVGGALGIVSQLGFDMGSTGGGVFSGENLILLMKSRVMIENALLTKVKIGNQSLTLADQYIKYNEFRKEWSNKPELKQIQFPPNADRTLFSRVQDSLMGVFYNNLIRDNVTVDKVDKQASIVRIAVNSENEQFAKYFAEILAKEVSDFYIETKTKKSAENLAILQHQTDSVRRMLNNAIAGVATSSDVNPNANPVMQVLRVPSQRKQIDVQANQAILTELVKNLEISKVSLRKETPLIQIIDRPIFPLEKQTFGKLKGLVLGGIIAAFICVILLLLKKIYQEIIF